MSGGSSFDEPNSPRQHRDGCPCSSCREDRLIAEIQRLRAEAKLLKAEWEEWRSMCGLRMSGEWRYIPFDDQDQGVHGYTMAAADAVDSAGINLEEP